MKKKYSLFIILIIINSINILSQPIYFNKTYDYQNNINGSTSLVITNDSGYLVAGQAVTNEYRGLHLVRIDKFGDTLWTKLIQKDNLAYFTGYSGSLIKSIEGGFALGGTIKVADSSEAKGIFIRFNENGDTIFTKTLGDTLDNEFNQCIQNSDGSYMLGGVTTNVQIGQADMWLVKLDFNGNFLWEKKYGGYYYENLFSLIHTIGGGYLLVGMTNSYGAGNYDVYVVKVDNVGNKIWQKTFGGLNSDSGANVFELKSGDFIITGGLDDNSMGRQGYLIKIDSAGTKIWEKTYGEIYNDSGNGNVIELFDKSVVFTGYGRNNQSSQIPRGWLNKVDSMGNVVWSRLFSFSNWDGPQYFRDMKQASDGGFIISGFCVNSLGINGGQDIWLLKVDSIGCPFANCDTIVGEIPIFFQSKEVKIFPNPANEYFYINGELEYPVTIQIFDESGKFVYSQTIKSQYEQVSIGSLYKNMYIYSIIEANGKFTNGKVVIEE